MTTTVYASFSNAEMAERAIGALLDHGVAAQDVGVAFNERYTPYTSEEVPTADEIRSHANAGITTTTPEDASAGAAKGAGVGLGVGALAAIASLTIPGVGLVLGGGALAIALGGMVGATAAGAIAGGATGYLKDQGLPEHLAQSYTKAITNGGAIVSVTAPSNDVNEFTIEEVLRKYEGADVHRLPAMPATAVVDDSMRDPTNVVGTR